MKVRDKVKVKIGDQRGMALIVALIMILSLTTIGVIAVNTSNLETIITANTKVSKQAFYISEAGAERARELLRTRIAGGSSLSSELNAVKGSDGVLVNSNSLSNFSNTDDTPFISSTSFGAGSFVVYLTNDSTDGVTSTSDSNGRVTITSFGYGPNNSRSVVQTTVEQSTYNPADAITTNGDLRISGNPTVQGTNGGVHSNSNLSLSGNPTISTDATASGTYSASGSPNIGGTAAGGQPTETIPAVTPSNFYSYRDYLLASDGKVYDRNGVEQLMPGNKWNNWDFSGGEWTLSGNSTINATLYIEGDAKISGNPGSQANPWIATIIATGDIEVSGNPTMRPPDSTTDGALFRSGTENLLFIAGRDIKISGNFLQNDRQGIIASHEQIDMSGNPTFNGFIIAEDAENVSSRVRSNNISGNMTITYNGGIGNPFKGDVFSKLSWKQLGL